MFLTYIFAFFFYLLIDKPINNIDSMILFPTKLRDSFLSKKKKSYSEFNPSLLTTKSDDKSQSTYTKGRLDTIEEENDNSISNLSKLPSQFQFDNSISIPYKYSEIDDERVKLRKNKKDKGKVSFADESEGSGSSQKSE